MKVTLVQPAMGRIGGKKFKRPWTIEPLSIASLARLTPPDVELNFFDDRIEDINYDQDTDLAAISVETFNALRSYEIAEGFRKRGVPVVLGGFHPTLIPQESENHGSVVLGLCV